MLSQLKFLILLVFLIFFACSSNFLVHVSEFPQFHLVAATLVANLYSHMYPLSSSWGGNVETIFLVISLKRFFPGERQIVRISPIIGQIISHLPHPVGCSLFLSFLAISDKKGKEKKKIDAQTNLSFEH